MSVSVGTTARIENFFDIGGEPVDPTDIVFTLKRPDDLVPITYTWPPDGGITYLEQGSFFVDFMPDVAGTWVYSWNASGSIEVTVLGTLEVVNADVLLMRVPQYLTSADLDVRIGAAKVDQLFDDDGDGVRDAIPLNTILVEAEDFAAARVLKAFSGGQVKDIGGLDETFKGHVAWVACELASERRPEFLAEDGKGRYWAQYMRAKEYFDLVSKSRLASAAESTVGRNRQSGGSISPQLNYPNVDRFIFAPNRSSPFGRGGFLLLLAFGFELVLRALMQGA